MSQMSQNSTRTLQLGSQGSDFPKTAVRSNMMDTMKRKSGEVFPMKKVKLDGDLSNQPNVQQKLFFVGSNN